MGSAADTKGNYKPQGGCNSVWPSSYPGVQFQLLSLHTENPLLAESLPAPHRDGLRGSVHHARYLPPACIYVFAAILPGAVPLLTPCCLHACTLICAFVHELVCVHAWTHACMHSRMPHEVAHTSGACECLGANACMSADSNLHHEPSCINACHLAASLLYMHPCCAFAH